MGFCGLMHRPVCALWLADGRESFAAELPRSSEPQRSCWHQGEKDGRVPAGQVETAYACEYGCKIRSVGHWTEDELGRTPPRKCGWLSTTEYRCEEAGQTDQAGQPGWKRKRAWRPTRGGPRTSLT